MCNVSPARLCNCNDLGMINLASHVYGSHIPEREQEYISFFYQGGRTRLCSLGSWEDVNQRSKYIYVIIF